MINILCWNICNNTPKAWEKLHDMDVDLALLQEARNPPNEIAHNFDCGPNAHWDSHVWNSNWWRSRDWKHLYDRWPKIVKISDRVEVEWFKQVGTVEQTRCDEIAVSGIGTIAAARVTPRSSGEPFIAVSMYGRWMTPHPTARGSDDYADTSAHRIISDLSVFIGHQDTASHRILAAGDLNVLYGYGEDNNNYRAQRYASVFDRMRAVGLSFRGPQTPNGRQADPWPDELPKGSRNVPTHRTDRRDPATATRQLDFVFASKGFDKTVSVRALNEPEPCKWGPSDHCRILIKIEDVIE